MVAITIEITNLNLQMNFSKTGFYIDNLKISYKNKYTLFNVLGFIT